MWLFYFKRTFLNKNRNNNKSLGLKGFGLVETIVGVAVFSIVAISAYGGFAQLLRVLNVLKVKTLATNLSNEQIEIVRNLPYTDVGIINGLPVGKIPRNQTISRDGVTFDVTTSVQDVDDPFDGTIGGTPNDLSPADYKLVEIILQCGDCAFKDEIKFYTRVSPLSLETQGSNGALFVQVFDSNGVVLQGANVHVYNNNGTSTVDIDEVTNNNGMFQIVDAPPGTNAYQITVTKDGYSTEKTYTIGDSLNPEPDKPHANVAVGQVTPISFAIDELSDLSVRSIQNTCETVPSVDFQLTGSKTIGYQVYKYDKNKVTNSGGLLDLIGLEWDNYTFDITDSGYDLAGSNNVLPLALNPGSEQNIDLIVVPKAPQSFLIQVVDGETGLALSDAEVNLTNTSGYDTSLITGKGFLGQTDWAGGSGQDTYQSNNKYYSQNGNVNDNGPAGDLKLASVSGSYLSSGQLESSTFDTGTTTNFGILNWGNFDQPAGSSAKFQIATNLEVTSTSTWDFIGPDGTNGSYYTAPGQALNDVHDGDRFLRYKLFLNTTDSNVTPSISNVAFTFGTDCAPPGQVLFQNLDTDFYALNIIKSGYLNYSVENVPITKDWQMLNVIMTP